MFAEDTDMSDLMFDPGPKHSTPIKERGDTGYRRGDGSPTLPTYVKKPCLPEGSRTGPVSAVSSSGSLSHTAHVSSTDPVRVSARDVSNIMNTAYSDMDSLVAQQRKEIASLMRELRERDHELNELVKSHQQQLCVWEQDRQHILRLQHKCHRLSVDLKQQKEKGIRNPGERCGNEDSKTQVELIHQSPCSDHSSLHLQQLQNRNDNLNDSLKEVSLAKGQLQAKEQELITLLKLKEKSVADAERTAGELRAQVKSLKLEKENQQSELEELVNTWQKRCQGLEEDKDKLVGACQEKDRQLQQATSQLQDTLQQAMVLQQALAISCEREKNKEELLISVKARQERLNLELNQMRNLYRRQNREMTLLQLTLDTSKESDPELSDCDKRAAHSIVRPNTSACIDGNIVALPTASTTRLQHGTEQKGAASPSTVQGLETAPLCASHEENADSSSDHNNTPRSNQYCRKDTKSSNFRTHYSPSANIVSNRSTSFQHHNDPNTNNNHTDSKCACSGQTSFPQHFHSAGQTAQVTYTQHSAVAHQDDGCVSNIQDDNDDGVNRVQDVDTEAFWQKILSVRHGNQNNLQETKDLPHSPVKSWLTEVHTEEEARHCQTDGSQLSRERCWQGQKPTNPDFLKDGSSPILAGTDAVTARNPVTKRTENQNMQRSLPNSDFKTQNQFEPALHHHQLTNQQRESPQEVPVFGTDTHVSSSHSQLQPCRWEGLRTSSAEARTTNHGQYYLHQNLKSDVSRISEDCGISGPSLSEGEADIAQALSTQFDEKLSSFLESPEDNTSVDPATSQGSCSPASKLHRLLMESQEMIKALEVRGQPYRS
ncbi:uncharacterized protein LOC143302287 [Babylonia areolata]|uniref:uncharacterized protein LOC143302287 n=1 Tax=Babylonia areolata TaxID=304850 RepID=UPI003FD445F7